MFLLYLVFIAFILRTIRSALYQSFLWQLKEYRWDRIWAHLHTTQGKKLILHPITLIKWPLVLIILVFNLFPIYIGDELNWKMLLFGSSAVFLWLLWIIEALINLMELITRGWRLPKFTPKIFFILGVVVIIQFVLPLYLGKELLLFPLPFLDKLLAPSIVGLVIFSNIPALFYKKMMIWRAKNKIAKLTKLFVIGITGSYGKTSTKEFLATILSEKFKVAKTPESHNTDIGIAKYIVKELDKDSNIFVVEMGAYKKNEITTICNIVYPKMGIITGIDEQHIELFGSLENTKKAKYELIESLAPSSTAIFNGNNKYCLEMADWAKKLNLKVMIYQTAKNITDVKIFPKHLEFTYKTDNNQFKMNTFLLGEHNIENILAAIYAAQILKMSLVDIKRGLNKITSIDKTMKLYQLPNGVKLIDDTFNANPNGVIAALKYMKVYTGKKILVLSPLIELGNKTDDIHKKIAIEAARICDLVFLTNRNFVKSFYEGFTQVGNKEKIKIVNKKFIKDTIKNELDKDDVIVFEGKEAGRILKNLKVIFNIQQ